MALEQPDSVNHSFELGFEDPRIQELAALIISGQIEVGGDGTEPDGGEFAMPYSPDRPPEIEGIDPVVLEQALGELAITSALARA